MILILTHIMRAPKEKEEGHLKFAIAVMPLRLKLRMEIQLALTWSDILSTLMMVQHYRPSENPRGIFARSEEHTSEIQSLMRISYAVFSLKKSMIKLYTLQ